MSKYGVVKNPSVDRCTTNIKPPAVIDYGSDTDFVNENMAIFQGMQESQTEEFSYSEYVVEMSLIRPVITEENMPNYLLLEQLPEDQRDLYCAICPKGGFNYEDLDSHYDRYHNVYFVPEFTFEFWKESEEAYANGYRPVFSDSDGGEDYQIDIGSSSDVPNE